MEKYMETKYSLIAEFYSAHYDELASYIFSRLQDADEAEDIVQNVFLRLLQTDQMISPVTLPCLVYTMARNMVVDFWRRRNQCDKYEHFIKGGPLWQRASNDVESLFSAHEVTEMLERGIAKLTDGQARVYRLNIYEGMPVSQIASELHLNYKCAENRLGAARKKVRGFLAKSLAG